MPPFRLRLATVGAAIALAAAPVAPLVAAAGEDPEPTAQRTITSRGVEPRDGVFLVRGRVDPAYAERRAVLQRKLRKEQQWHRWRRFRTSPTSRYRQRVEPLRRPGAVCYRVRIKGNQHYLESFSRRVCIRTYWK